MDQPEYLLEFGTRVRTHKELESTRGMNVHVKNLAARRTDAEGIIFGVVGGHGGDVYWVAHDTDIPAAYCFTEFELVEEAQSD